MDELSLACNVGVIETVQFRVIQISGLLIISISKTFRFMGMYVVEIFLNETCDDILILCGCGFYEATSPASYVFVWIFKFLLLYTYLSIYLL